MFVFRAAVVGAGTMGGQIAQTIAAAGIPVVLKDIDDALVQAGLEEARNVTRGQVAKLDAATPGHAILASNTSSLSITEIGEATLRPEKVIGFHYFYPASVMPLIEIVEGEETAAETVSAAITFAQAIRKQPITCVEVPGFVVNRILNSS